MWTLTVKAWPFNFFFYGLLRKIFFSFLWSFNSHAWGRASMRPVSFFFSITLLTYRRLLICQHGLLRISLRFYRWPLFACKLLNRWPRVPKRIVYFWKNHPNKIRWPSWPNLYVGVRSEKIYFFPVFQNSWNFQDR